LQPTFTGQRRPAVLDQPPAESAWLVGKPKGFLGVPQDPSRPADDLICCVAVTLQAESRQCLVPSEVSPMTIAVAVVGTVVLCEPPGADDPQVRTGDGVAV